MNNMKGLYSWLDYYPCGEYNLTKTNGETICKLDKNVTSFTLGKNKTDKELYDTKSIIENFRVGKKIKKKNYLWIIIILVLIFFFALKKNIYI